MTLSAGTNPPCEMCGTMTLIHSDHSGGWNECPECGWLQDIRRTPPGEGRLTGQAPPAESDDE